MPVVVILVLHLVQELFAVFRSVGNKEITVVLLTTMAVIFIAVCITPNVVTFVSHITNHS